MTNHLCPGARYFVVALKDCVDVDPRRTVASTPCPPSVLFTSKAGCRFNVEGTILPQMWPAMTKQTICHTQLYSKPYRVMRLHVHRGSITRRSIEFHKHKHICISPSSTSLCKLLTVNREGNNVQFECFRLTVVYTINRSLFWLRHCGFEGCVV